MKWLEKVVWLMALLWTAAALVPASFWYDGDDMRIDDVRAGRPVELFYSGGPLRSFVGSYAVIMRDIEAREIVGEDRSARFTYRTNGQRPVPLTLAWWAPGNARLQSLPPGRYQMETCWTVHDAFWGAGSAEDDMLEKQYLSDT